MSLIQQLIRDGDMVLWHSYKTGSFHDWSGQGNDGTPDATTVWAGGGLEFPNNAADIVVPDAAELQLTAGALIVVGDFMQQSATEYFFSKKDGGGTNYEFYMNATQLLFHDGANERTLNLNVTGGRTLAVNFSSGSACEGYFNGVSQGTFSDTSTVTTDDADLIIGNVTAGSNQFDGSMWEALIVNRVLTDTEMSELHGEIVS